MAHIIGTNLDDQLFGSPEQDIIEGRDGNDLLDGGLGGDSMYGGRGDDVFVIDSPGDLVSELFGEGIDEVRSSISYTLGSNVENLTLTGAGTISGFGNSLNNRISGNDAANVFRGGGGTDTFIGGGGNDVYYVVGEVAVSRKGVYSFTGVDQVVEAVGGGTDTIFSNVSLTLGANVEKLTLTGNLNLTATGNGAGNTIVANSGQNYLRGLEGNDYLDGGVGADQMHGGTGNDTFVVDNGADFVVEQMDSGTDTVLSSISYSLHLELENLTLRGAAAIDGTGNYRVNRMFGNSAANRLDGKEGDDLLDGKGGNDTLDGGIGADRYIFSTNLHPDNIDAILGFESAADRIVLDDAVFKGLARGGLSAGAFHTGAAATDAAHRVVYDSVTGTLAFDIDGAGGAGAVTFAALQPNLALTAANFLVV